jgi:hypothetical protein
MKKPIELVVFANPYMKIRVGVVERETKKGLWIGPAGGTLGVSCIQPEAGFIPFWECIARTTNVDLVRRTMCTVVLVDRQYEESAEGLKKAHQQAIRTTLEPFTEVPKASKV